MNEEKWKAGGLPTFLFYSDFPILFIGRIKMGSINAFIIHSGKDEKEVLRLLEDTQIKDLINHDIKLTRQKEKAPKLWKPSVRKGIREAQVILLFIGENTSSSKNIGWEIKTAIRYKKKIIYLDLGKENKLPRALSYKDNYSNKVKIYGDKMTKEQIICFLNDYRKGNYHLLNNNDPEDKTTKSMLFDQYKLFLQTSETLVNRRQSVNSFYITLNTSLLALFTPVSGLIADLKLKIVVIIAFFLIGLILCISWRQLLESYGNLNSSKMKILSILEKNLPASLYDAEWEVMSDQLNKRKYVSFTASEKRIPLLFLVLYVMICIILVVYYLFVCK